MPVSKKLARRWLTEQNKNEYRDVVLASHVWDSQVEAILDLHIRKPKRLPQLTYRAARSRVSWQYQMKCYGTFHLYAPTLWQVLRTYGAWRKFLVESVRRDLQRNAFTGADAWLNRGPELAQRQEELHNAQLAVLRAHFVSLLQAVSPYDQLRIKCAMAVVFRSRATGEGGDICCTDVLGPGGIGPIRPIAE